MRFATTDLCDDNASLLAAHRQKSNDRGYADVDGVLIAWQKLA